MKIYNTLTRQKEEFIPIHPGKAGVYVCGPTVYNYIHIGNARPLCVFDTLRRFLEYQGYEVCYVSNFTDVDDKIIRRSLEEGIPAREVSEKYIQEFLKDAEGLHVRPSTHSPKVTENMGIILEIIENLVEKGFAYESGGDVYFRTKRFAEYGKLSHMPLDDLNAGARVDVSEQKEDPMDFAVWKAAKEGEPFWESPWGKGRPGWHIECSAMSRHYVGDTLDIHGGGQDLIFPHHENEIAQSEAATGKPLAKYWMHNGYINIDNKKMSKSAGNFFTVRQVAERYGYEPIRFLMVQSHYRSPINYTDEVMEAAKASLERLYHCLENLTRSAEAASPGPVTPEQQEIFTSRKRQFAEAMEDDLNTADALAAIFELVRELNTLAREPGTSQEALQAGKSLLQELCGVLGLLLESREEEIPEAVLDLLERRKAARKEKNFALADQLRDEITGLGYLVEETRQGTKISKKR